VSFPEASLGFTDFFITGDSPTAPLVSAENGDLVEDPAVREAGCLGLSNVAESPSIGSCRPKESEGANVFVEKFIELGIDASSKFSPGDSRVEFGSDSFIAMRCIVRKASL
jgi:hypothetical protein